jgi:hypothetical protein
LLVGSPRAGFKDKQSFIGGFGRQGGASVYWSTIKRSFFVCISVYLVFKAFIMIALRDPSMNSYHYELLNSVTLIDLVGLLSVVLGIILIGRWIWTKGNRSYASRKEELTPQKINLTERWAALVEYDNDIRMAAEELRPFGESWVNEFGQAYVALNEDRRYIPNIVRRLKEKAEQEKIDNLQEQWEKRFRYTACGELCTSESLSLLREAERQGYILGVEKDGTFTLTKNGGTTLVRSNADIQQLFGLSAKSKKQESPECDLPPLASRQGPHDYKGYPYYFYPDGDVVDGLIQREWWRVPFSEFKRAIDSITAARTRDETDSRANFAWLQARARL